MPEDRHRAGGNPVSENVVKVRFEEAFQAASRALGVGVRRRRAELSLSVQQVAARAGLESALIDRIEGGQANPTSTELTLLAEALKVEPAGLFVADRAGRKTRLP